MHQFPSSSEHSLLLEILSRESASARIFEDMHSSSRVCLQGWLLGRIGSPAPFLRQLAWFSAGAVGLSRRWSPTANLQQKAHARQAAFATEIFEHCTYYCKTLTIYRYTF